MGVHYKIPSTFLFLKHFHIKGKKANQLKMSLTWGQFVSGILSRALAESPSLPGSALPVPPAPLPFCHCYSLGYSFQPPRQPPEVSFYHWGCLGAVCPAYSSSSGVVDNLQMDNCWTEKYWEAQYFPETCLSLLLIAWRERCKDLELDKVANTTLTFLLPCPLLWTLLNLSWYDPSPLQMLL